MLLHNPAEDEEFQSPDWPPAAEAALVAAWKAAEGQPVGNRLQQLAVMVMRRLGKQHQEVSCRGLSKIGAHCALHMQKMSTMFVIVCDVHLTM